MVTAMTSLSATAVEVVAAMATMGDSHRSNIELTAADNAAQPANVAPAQDPSQESPAPNHQEDQPRYTEPVKEEVFENERPNSTTEASIPQDPEQRNNLELYQMENLAEMEGKMALAAMTMEHEIFDGDRAYAATPADALHMNEADNSHQPYLGATPYLQEADEPRIEAYALLQFDDMIFYMNTYSVILGRDMEAARAAARRAEEEAQRMEDEACSREPRAPVRIKQEGSKHTRSVISESGGILREGKDSDSDERARRRKSRKASKKSKSTGSSSHRISRRNSLAQPNGNIDYQPQPQPQPQVSRYAPDSAGAVPVDPASLRPSPHECPIIKIHPPAATGASGYQAISRMHVKIAYNFQKHLFEAKILGRNGAFVDQIFYHHSNVVPLKSGSELQIGGVVVKFVLPDVAIGETGAEHSIDYEDGIVANRYSEGGKEMSFDFEDAPRDGALIEETSEDASDASDDEGLQNEEEFGDGGELDAEEGDGEEEEENSDLSGGPDGEEEEEDEEDLEVEEVREPSPNPPKRRGPGRPPKNGVMSKREQQLAKREAQQKVKKSVPQPSTTGKNKVGRPRKHPRPETPPIKTEKRKYTKRKAKDLGLGVKQEGSQDDDKLAKEKKEKKASKPPRSPSPTFNEADLTPEQLAKPQTNYVTLIHEALSNSPTGQMSLPQIYRAIQRRYPYYVLKTNTNGWQSSVRHNLSQHHAFRKVERDGKGWMWAIVDGVSIEKEKKRRPTPPNQLPPGHMHQIYRAGSVPQHMMPRPPGMMGPPPGYPMNGNLPANPQPGQPPNYAGLATNGYTIQGSQTPVNGQHSSGFTGPLTPNPPIGPQGSSYSSPYATKPTVDTAPPQNASNIGFNHSLSTLGSPPPPFHQQPRANYQQGPQQPNDNIARAIDTFKTALTASLKGKSNNAEAVVASAINRVLGIATQSTVPGDPNEEKIMVATRAMLSKLPGASFSNAQVPQPSEPPQQQQAPPSRPSQPLGVPNNQSSTPNQAGVTPANTTKLSAPVISRPSFSGQGQSRPPSVPRPPMMTPGMARANSGSPAHAPSRPSGLAAPAPASPAIVPAPAPLPGTGNGNGNDAAVYKPSMNDNGKRPLEDAGDVGEKDFKRLSAGGPPPLKA